jgi:hypothetical protein
VLPQPSKDAALSRERILAPVVLVQLSTDPTVAQAPQQYEDPPDEPNVFCFENAYVIIVIFTMKVSPKFS